MSTNPLLVALHILLPGSLNFVHSAQTDTTHASLFARTPTSRPTNRVCLKLTLRGGYTRVAMWLASWTGARARRGRAGVAGG
jgi:hypothetical protein